MSHQYVDAVARPLTDPPRAAPAVPGISIQPVLLLRVEDVDLQLNASRATVNRLLASGVLPSVKLGRSRRILYRDLERFVADLADGHVDAAVQRALGQDR